MAVPTPLPYLDAATISLRQGLNDLFNLIEEARQRSRITPDVANLLVVRIAHLINVTNECECLVKTLESATIILSPEEEPASNALLRGQHAPPPRNTGQLFERK
jgi:hypothetical protein